jgi:cytidylate kinase
LGRHIQTADEILATVNVAIDGPAGSGKSTTARLVSERLGLKHVDTGAMYRAIALLALRSGIDPGDGPKSAELARSAEITFEEIDGGGQRVFLSREDVTDDIRTPEVTKAVSPVSAHPGVRSALVRAQRRIADRGGCVLEGRDIGTVVLPNAEVKVYLSASTKVRAKRRLKEFHERGIEASLEAVEQDIIKRDKFDSEREHSPLRKAVGAAEIDTSDLSIDGQVDRVVEIARQVAARLEGLAAKQGSGKSPALRRRLIYCLIIYFVQSVIRILFRFRVRRMLKENYDENYIYACNHIANTDPPFISSCLPREVYFLAKASLFKNPLFGGLIRALNAIPLRRGIFDREAMDQALDLLREQRSLMIFPEGGRIFGGKLGKPKSGVGYLAVNSGVAVVPVYVTGTDKLRRCFLGRAKLRVIQGRPIRLMEGSVEDMKNRDTYRAYGEMVMAAIAALKEEMDEVA